jgi:predicted nucleic acid-binding protein
VILDTSVLIDPVELPEDVEAAISAVSIAELHFGLLVGDANPRKRSADLAIAATANVHNATLLTRNLKDFTIIADLISVSAP